MSPLLGLALMPVARRSMSSAHVRVHGGISDALPWLVATALFLFSGAPPASAGETSPGAPPASDSNLQAEITPGAESGQLGATVRSDSLVTSAAVRDSVPKGAEDDTRAKGSEPADRVENASTAPEEKAGETVVSPSTLSRQAEPPKVEAGETAGTKAPTAKVDAPKPGVKGVAVRGPKGPPKSRAVSKTPVTRRRSTGAPKPPVLAHYGFTEADRVSAELERTERFVGRAQKSIVLSKNTRAIKLFTSALDFQSDSREAYKVRQYARAERLTLASRDFADRASRMVGPPREDPDYVEHVLRRTDDALDRAQDVLKTGAGRYAWSQHEELKEEQKDAWKVFKSGDVGSAYKQTLGVREGVLVLLRQLQDLPVPRETAEKAIGGAQAALEQASRELGPKPSLEAMRLVRLANEYLVKARQSFSRGSYRSALLQAKVVERHVEHAVDVGRPGSG